MCHGNHGPAAGSGAVLLNSTLSGNSGSLVKAIEIIVDQILILPHIETVFLPILLANALTTCSCETQQLKLHVSGGHWQGSSRSFKHPPHNVDLSQWSKYIPWGTHGTKNLTLLHGGSCFVANDHCKLEDPGKWKVDQQAPHTTKHPEEALSDLTSTSRFPGAK